MPEGATERDLRAGVGAIIDRSAVFLMVRLLRSVLRQAPRQVALVLVLTFVQVFTSGVSLVMLVPLLGIAGLDVGSGSVGRLADVTASAFGVLGVSLTVPAVIVAYLAVVFANAAVGHALSVRSAHLYQGFAMVLRWRMYEAITRVDWSAYVRRPSSSFLHALTQETARVSGALASMLSLAVKLVMTGVYFGLAIYLSTTTTLIVAAFGGSLMALLVPKTRLGRKKGEAVSDASAALYGSISEHLAGMRVTKSHGSEPVHLERLAERTRMAADAQIAVVRNEAEVGFWLQIGSAFIMAGMFSAAFLVLELPLATILILLFLFARLVPQLTGVQRQLQAVFSVLPAVDRVEAMLAWLAEHAEPEQVATGAPPFGRLLRLEGVAFRYEGADGDTVLDAVTIEIPAGRTTAVVGASGSGKSTVADLVVGLLTPDEGRILIDDAPLEGGRLAAWRRGIGYVNQDTFLFHDSIRANLLLVRPEASEIELAEALSAASADFVMALPDGLDTVVGDRGVRLSGGERQRIALARAILRRPALLVLDEATSALDPENERVIQEAIARMAGKQTLLVIAHRLSSVRAADAIYVMERGRVVESGTWDELVRRPGGRFQEMCRAQGLLAEQDAHPYVDGRPA